MYFTYLGRELRRRMRQAIFIALGLALGIGLVITVTAAATGVKNAQGGVLKALYGVGTDASHTVVTHLTASVSASVIILAVVLAVAGGVIAGMFGGWRAARLRPADALSKVA
jgi:ABC-type lipoprotein release transport system permease subunit